MAETSESTSNLATPEEIAEVIAELEQYRNRLESETIETAKKAKMKKAAVMAQLEPELAKIDATLQTLREQHAALVADN